MRAEVHSRLVEVCARGELRSVRVVGNCTLILAAGYYWQEKLSETRFVYHHVEVNQCRMRHNS